MKITCMFFLVLALGSANARVQREDSILERFMDAKQNQQSYQQLEENDEEPDEEQDLNQYFDDEDDAEEDGDSTKDGADEDDDDADDAIVDDRYRHHGHNEYGGRGGKYGGRGGGHGRRRKNEGMKSLICNCKGLPKWVYRIFSCNRKSAGSSWITKILNLKQETGTKASPTSQPKPMKATTSAATTTTAKPAVVKTTEPTPKPSKNAAPTKKTGDEAVDELIQMMKDLQDEKVHRRQLADMLNTFEE